MIFDGLPILSAGSGSKLYGPRLTVFTITYKKNSPKTIRLEGKGILSFYGLYGASSSGQNFTAKPFSDLASGTVECEVDGHDIDNLGITSTGAISTDNLYTGYSGWAVKKISTDTSFTNIPTPIMFQEYFQLTFSHASTTTQSAAIGLEYYEIDEEDNVTASII